MPIAAESQECRPRIAVVGAGITGLAAAFRLIRRCGDVQVEIFDPAPRAGGTICTDHRDGFLIEHGADAFITNKSGGLKLCQDLGISDQLVETDDQYRRTLVVHRGQPVLVPDGFMLMAPIKPVAVLKSPILSLGGKLRLLTEALRRGKNIDEDESLASFARRRFGAETFERLIQPLVGGIYTADPEKLSLKATLPRFLAMEREHGSVIRAVLKASNSAAKQEHSTESGARYGLFVTHASGLSALVESIIATLKVSGRVKLHFGAAVDCIEPAREPDTGWQVRAGSQNQMTFQGVVLAAPSWVAAKLLGSVDSDVAAKLKAIEYTSTVVVASAHRLSDFRHPLDAFGMVVPLVENRKILAVSFSSRKFAGRAPQGSVLLRTFVGGAAQPELLRMSDGEILKTVIDELGDLLGLAETPLFASVWRHERAMPQYHVGHLDRIDRLEQQMSIHQGLELAGNAYHGVGVPDCISSGYAAADRLAESKGL